MIERQRKRRRVAPRIAILATSILVAVTGCSNANSTAKPATSASITGAGSPVPVIDAAVRDNPLTEELNRNLAYAVTDAEMGVVVDATQEGVLQCMRARGFDYTKIVGFQLVGDRSQHPLDIDAGREFGFHFVPIAPPPNPNEDRIQSVSYADALRGSDERDGCEQLASQLVASYEVDYLIAYYALDALLVDAVNEAKTSESVLASESSYRRCLSDQGFDPDDFASERYAFQDQAAVSTEEVHAREIDYECDVETSRTASFSESLRTAYEQFVESHPQDVKHAVEMKQSYLRSLGELVTELRSGTVTVDG